MCKDAPFGVWPAFIQAPQACLRQPAIWPFRSFKGPRIYRSFRPFWPVPMCNLCNVHVVHVVQCACCAMCNVHVVQCAMCNLHIFPNACVPPFSGIPARRGSPSRWRSRRWSVARSAAAPPWPRPDSSGRHCSCGRRRDAGRRPRSHRWRWPVVSATRCARFNYMVACARLEPQRCSTVSSTRCVWPPPTALAPSRQVPAPAS